MFFLQAAFSPHETYLHCQSEPPPVSRCGTLYRWSSACWWENSTVNHSSIDCVHFVFVYTTGLTLNPSNSNSFPLLDQVTHSLWPWIKKSFTLDSQWLKIRHHLGSTLKTQTSLTHYANTQCNINTFKCTSTVCVHVGTYPALEEEWESSFSPGEQRGFPLHSLHRGVKVQSALVQAQELGDALGPVQVPVFVDHLHTQGEGSRTHPGYITSHWKQSTVCHDWMYLYLFKSLNTRVYRICVTNETIVN